MTAAAAPDPRFRDQLAEALEEHSPVYSEVYDEQRCACGSPIWDGIDAHRADTIAAEVEARVQTAGDQRAASALTDAWPSVWAVLDRHGHGQSHMALQASEVIYARAAALASPAPAPQTGASQ